MSKKAKIEVVLLDGKEYLTPEVLAKRWKTTEAYLRNRRSDSKGLSYYKPYGRVLYSLEDVLAYEEQRKTIIGGKEDG